VTTRPPFIVHWSEIQEDDDSMYPGSSERHSIGSPLGKHTGLTQLGVHHELLPPGRRTSWPHAEGDEDELVYVLEGHPRVWIDGVVHALRPGDAVGFPCGTGIAHTFLNDTERPVRLLAVGLASAKGHRVHYPLHPGRNEQLGEARWLDVPARELGPHDGLPFGIATPRRERTAAETRREVPVLETASLRLRPHELRDAHSIFAMRRSEGALDHLSFARPESVDEITPTVMRVMAENGWSVFAWVIETREDARFVGAMGVIRLDAPGLLRGEPGGMAEVGAEIDHAFRAKHVVREAGEAVGRFAFETLGFHRLEVRTSPKNVGAIRAAEAMGFEREGVLRKSFRHPDGTFTDTMLLSRIAPQKET
jgi:uncharacterized cupin superfamily protein/RimJ/RimL family protein N-acetyltransferase